MRCLKRCGYIPKVRDGSSPFSVPLASRGILAFCVFLLSSHQHVLLNAYALKRLDLEGAKRVGNVQSAELAPLGPSSLIQEEYERQKISSFELHVVSFRSKAISYSRSKFGNQ